MVAGEREKDRRDRTSQHAAVQWLCRPGRKFVCRYRPSQVFLMNDVRFNKVLILVNGAVPLALLAWDASTGSLGANPIEFFLRTTGVLTLLFVLITLTVTPLRKLFGINEVIKY